MSYQIRLARLQDVPKLHSIEKEAGTLFEGWLPNLAGTLVSEETFAHACQESRLFVAVDGQDEPVGFALLLWVDGQVHLEELDVYPAHGRQGLGARLVEATLQWARERGKQAVTLTTFREIPWNAPFYRRLGFVELGEEELGPELRGIRDKETEKGLDPAGRCVMRRSP
jgi:GNAT superfamily N-acetyltransferase